MAAARILSCGDHHCLLQCIVISVIIFIIPATDTDIDTRRITILSSVIHHSDHYNVYFQIMIDYTVEWARLNIFLPKDVCHNECNKL